MHTKFESKKEALKKSIGKYLLKHGIASASLRNLAKYCNTNDRMLIYYFKSRDALLEETLNLLAHDLLKILDEVDPEQKEPHDLIALVGEVFGTRKMKPYLKLWIELLGFAATDSTLKKSVIGDLLLLDENWIRSRLLLKNESSRDEVTSLLLSIVEGMALLQIFGQSDRFPEITKGIIALER